MIAVSLPAGAQARPPTVGDTVWIGMTVRVPPRMVLRPQTWDLGTEAQVLGPPEIVYAADSAIVRYPLAFWTAGEHQLSIPGPIVVSPEGKSDTLATIDRRIQIQSVLPAGVPRTTLAPRDPAPRLPQSGRSLLPVVLAIGVGLVIISAVALGWWRRRARRRMPVVAPRPPEPDLVARVEQWAALGETRSALDGWSHLIEREAARAPDSDASRAATPFLDALALGGFQARLSPAESDRLLRAARAWWNGRVR